MKTRYIIMAATTALAVLSGCAKEQEAAAPGKFHLRAAIEASADTRITVDNTGKTAWATGDKIAVYVGDAFTPIEIENPETGDFTIDAPLDPEQRSYYAVYPAGIQASTPADPTLKVELPAAYDMADWADDYSPVPMVAENDADQDILYFRHVGGLLRFITDNVPSGTSSVKVTFDKDITGVYTVNASDPSAPAITSTALSTANTVTFTGFAAGSARVLNIPVPCGTYGSVTVEYVGSGNPAKEYNMPMTFDRRHAKVLVDGGSGYQFYLGSLNAVETENTGGTKDLAMSFVSYKSNGTIVAPTPFVLQYSDDGVSGWSETPPSWLTPDARIDYSGYTSEHKLMISISPQDNTAHDVHAEALQEDDPTKWAHDVDLSFINVATGETSTRVTANCYVVDRPGTYRFPAVYGNGVIGSSVNTDAFRTKMGDGDYWDMDEEDQVIFKFNYETFSSEGEDDELAKYGYLGRLLDHTDAPITNPYIALQLGQQSLTIRKAELLWTDADGLVTNVGLEGTGQDTFIKFEVPNAKICEGNAVIAVFDNKDRIAWSWHIWVTDQDLKVDDKPQYSVGGYTFAPVNIGWCAPRDLVRFDERTVYVRARQLENTDEGNNTSNIVEVKSKAGRIIVAGGNSTYYQWGRKDPIPSNYQLFDNLLSTPSLVNKDVFAPDEYTPAGFMFYDLGISLGIAIQNPYIAYSSGIPHLYNWSNTFRFNLWNARLDHTGVDEENRPDEMTVTKTIYDPSPSGYKVPNLAAFKAFNNTNLIWEKKDGDNGRFYGDYLFFPLSGYRDAYFDARLSSCFYWSANSWHVHHEASGYGLSFNSEDLSKYNSTNSYFNSNPVRPIAE